MNNSNWFIFFCHVVIISICDSNLFIFQCKSIYYFSKENIHSLNSHLFDTTKPFFTTVVAREKTEKRRHDHNRMGTQTQVCTASVRGIIRSDVHVLNKLTWNNAKNETSHVRLTFFDLMDSATAKRNPLPITVMINDIISTRKWITANMDSLPTSASLQTLIIFTNDAI